VVSLFLVTGPYPQLWMPVLVASIQEDAAHSAKLTGSRAERGCVPTPRSISLACEVSASTVLNGHGECCVLKPPWSPRSAAAIDLGSESTRQSAERRS
jgi:hypothetical protein